MKAALYARVSTDKQSESSVQEQLRRCRQYADMKGWEIVGEFTDVGSGMNTEREGFQSLMEADWDVVIAYKLDRFHRSATNAQLWAKHLDNAGRNFVAIDYDIDTTSIHGRLIYTILTALAEMEVELTKERTRMGLQGVKNDGRWVGKPPYGYDSIFKETGEDGDKGLLRLNQEQAEVVSMVFELHNQGQSLTDIAEALTSARVLTKTGKLRWSTATIGDMIKRKSFYQGVYYDAENELRRYDWDPILEA
jgi:site-specific DNA recombinase